LGVFFYLGLLLTFFMGCQENNEKDELSSPSCEQYTGASDTKSGPGIAEPLDPFEQNSLLGRGVNLGNALEAPNEGEWGITLEEEFFDLIKNVGFNSVRIPIRWSAHTNIMSPFGIHPGFLNRVDWAVEQALSRGLMAVINIHHYEKLMEDPDAHRKRYLAIWCQLADHYKNMPGELLFDLLNEPNTNLTPELWNDLLVDALSVIRETNPYRTLIIGTAQWGGLGALDDLSISGEETNAIVSAHYYEPFQFTHQGAEWVSGSDPWLGTIWGSAQDYAAVEKDFDRLLSWSQENNRPVRIGEFGAYSKADINSRVMWTAHVARSAEERGFSWAYWEFAAGFGVYNPSSRSWNQELLESLISP
jgi:endoglucanase